MPNTELGNVPAQPVYGEVQEIDAQVAGAPIPQEAVDAVPAQVADMAVPAQTPTGYTPENNIVSVLPPPSTSPANTRAMPLSPQVKLAQLILGTPGMSGFTRSLASQLAGNFPEESYLPEEQLDAEGQANLRILRMQAQMQQGQG